MKKRWMRIISIVMALTIAFGPTVNVLATTDGESRSSAEAAPAEEPDNASDTVPTSGAAAPGTDEDEPVRGPEAAPEKAPAADGTDLNDAPVKTDPGTGNTDGSADENTDNGIHTNIPDTNTDKETGTKPSDGTETDTEKKNEDFSGNVTVDEDELKGVVTVEEDKNDDKAEIKKNDLNAASIDAAISMIAGTCRSMGVTVVD